MSTSVTQFCINLMWQQVRPYNNTSIHLPTPVGTELWWDMIGGSCWLASSVGGSRTQHVHHALFTKHTTAAPLVTVFRNEAKCHNNIFHSCRGVLIGSVHHAPSQLHLYSKYGRWKRWTHPPHSVCTAQGSMTHTLVTRDKKGNTKRIKSNKQWLLRLHSGLVSALLWGRTDRKQCCSSISS